MVIGTEGRGPEFLYVRMREKNGLVPEKVLGTAKGSYSVPVLLHFNSKVHLSPLNCEICFVGITNGDLFLQSNKRVTDFKGFGGD